jgi:hypothetical protein
LAEGIYPIEIDDEGKDEDGKAVRNRSIPVNSVSPQSSPKASPAASQNEERHQGEQDRVNNEQSPHVDESESRRSQLFDLGEPLNAPPKESGELEASRDRSVDLKKDASPISGLGDSRRWEDPSREDDSGSDQVSEIHNDNGGLRRG